MKGNQRHMPQDVDRGNKEMLENKDREIGRLQQQVQAVQKEKDKEKDRCEKLEKVLQQIGVQGDLEIEQWRKAVEAERVRADTAEKTVSELQIKAQGTEKQMQVMQQQMAQLEQQAVAAAPAAGNKDEVMKLHKELDKAQQDLKNAAVERERFQAQLEMLVQELERNQVSWRIAQTSTGVLTCVSVVCLTKSLLISIHFLLFLCAYIIYMSVFTVKPSYVKKYFPQLSHMTLPPSSCSSIVLLLPSHEFLCMKF
jgi:predicted  nucleic acid-binding Zn-ribbon protein